MKTKTFVLASAALWLAAGSASAQIQIDKRRPASKDGVVSVESSFGAVKVVGWEKDEVAVTGQLAAAAEGLDLDGDKDSVSVQVLEPHYWSSGPEDDSDFRSSLEVHVPRGSSVEVRTVNASITVEGTEGSLSLETVNGAVNVSGAPREVEINTVTGGVDVQAAGAPMRVETVSGNVTLRGGARAAEVRTVSGVVQLGGRDFERVGLETTSGDVSFEGGFSGSGGVGIETFSGNVTLVIPPTAAARFHFATFSGQIDSGVGPKPRKSERFSPYQELRFSTGLTDFDVEVKTYSGNIALRINPMALKDAPQPQAKPDERKPKVKSEAPRRPRGGEGDGAELDDDEDEDEEDCG